jgi:DNA topoisomerase-1
MSVDEEIESEKEKISLPELSKGIELKVNKLEPKQHFTMPPPRFSEASLVKELEENGIGRPSTYASILSTIREKGYVNNVKGYFKPSELGFIVNDLLVKSFPDIFDVDFTAKMEEDLDRIETSGTDSLEILSRFYGPFKKELDAASKNMLSIRGVGIPTDLSCPECSKQLNIKVGKNGHYLACNGYPECKYTRNYTRNEKGKIQPIEISKDEISDKVCEKCKKPMVLKQGKYGKFLACSGYPECKNTKSLNSNQTNKSTGVKCPEKDCKGELVEKTSKRGKIFYGCSRYPDCTFAIWDKPVPETCPDCGAEFLVEKTTKKQGTFLMCLNKECGYKKIL